MRIRTTTAMLVSALLLAVPILASNAVPAGAGAPTGFTSSLVLGGLDAGLGGNPVAFAYAPDGRIFVARKSGVIDVWDAGVQHVYLDIQDEVNSAQGRLLATLGDAVDPGINNGDALQALNLDDLRGKLIRIDRNTGLGVAGNPYFNAAQPGSVRSRVYARGLRNAYRFTVDPDNGT